MSNHLTTTEKLSIEPCKFILLQSKLHSWLIADKQVTCKMIEELLAEGSVQTREFLTDLPMN